jgi:hypothetical protein
LRSAPTFSFYQNRHRIQIAQDVASRCAARRAANGHAEQRDERSGASFDDLIGARALAAIFDENGTFLRMAAVGATWVRDTPTAGSGLGHPIIGDPTAWLGRQDSNLCIRLRAAEPDQLPHAESLGESA